MEKERTSADQLIGINPMLGIAAIVAEAFAEEIDREIMADLKKMGGEDNDRQRENM